MRIYKPNEEIPAREYFKLRHQKIEEEIRRLKDDYIINVNQEGYIDSLVVKHSILFEIFYSTERLIEKGESEEQEILEEFPGYFGEGRIHKYRAYHLCLKYKYAGDINVLRICPDSFSFSTLYNPLPIDVDGDELVISFSVRDIDEQKLQHQIDVIKKNAFMNLDSPQGAMWQVRQFNEQLPQRIKQMFERIKAEKMNKMQVFSKLGITNAALESIAVPILRKVVFTPSLIENQKVLYHIEDGVYAEILKHIYSFYKDVEQHESTYKGKHEEDLRNLVISSLNAAFIGLSSTAETFNHKGKTDILTRAQDGSNVFVAECKIWTGEKNLLGAIDQLLGYVTWRDTRTALIIFVKNDSITEIIEKAQSSLKTHPCFVEFKGAREKSSFSYIYHTKEDSHSRIALELMLFHYPD